MKEEKATVMEECWSGLDLVSCNNALCVYARTRWYMARDTPIGGGL